MTGIELNNVSFSFDLLNKKRIILQDVTYTFKRSKIIVILGKSGCGKTTVLKLINNLLIPNNGSINVNNYTISTVFQEPRLMPWLNIYKNVIFGLDNSVIDNDFINELFNLIKLTDYRRSYPYQLSGGMLSRVALIRALAIKPDYILLDEPFAALDYFTRIHLQKELLRLFNIFKMGIILVTHSIDEALLLADEILIMDDYKFKNKISLPAGMRDLLSNDFVQYKKEILMYLGERDI